MSEPKQQHGLVRRSRMICVLALVLLPMFYLASYRLLLVDEEMTPDQMAPGEPLVIIPPFPKACYREEYAVGGEGVRLFFLPANRLHRLVDRCLPLD